MRVCLLSGQHPTCNHLHRAAAVLDGEAAVTSTLPIKEWAGLLELSPEQRPDVVAIAGAADGASLRSLLGAGFNVLCEAPALEAEQAEDLARVVKQSGSILTVAWSEVAYPMARAAGSLIRDKKIGAVHSVFVDHHVPRAGTGMGGHVVAALAGAAENLLSTVTHVKLRAVCAEVVLNPVTRAHDDAQMLLRFEGHSRGVMTLSRTAARAWMELRVHGENGTLVWTSRNPAELRVMLIGKPEQVLTGADAESGALAAEAARNPAGAEGAVEAMANLYRGTYEAVRAKKEGRARKAMGRDLPTTSDLSRASRFVGAVMESARGAAVWVDV